MHRATGLALAQLDLVLTRPPKPLHQENVETINREALRHRQEKTLFSHRLNLLMKTADVRLEKSQPPYKRDFDKRVRQFSTGLRSGDLVFVKRETATASEERNRAARVAAIGHDKLQSKAIGPYHVVAVTTSTVAIIRDGLAGKVSKERVVRASDPSAKRICKLQKTCNLILQTARPPMSSHHLLENLRILPKTQRVILRTER